MHSNRYANEDNLINDFSAGRKEAVAELYRLFYSRLVYLTRQIVQDKNEAEDIVSNAFIKVINKSRDFDNIANIKAFLFTTTYRTAVDSLRHSRVHARMQKEMSYLSDGASMPDFDFLLVKTEILNAIAEEIDSLPKQCKEVFVQIFIKKKSTKEVAEILHLSDVTVRRQKQIAINLLRTALLKKQLLGSVALFIMLMNHESLM